MKKLILMSVVALVVFCDKSPLVIVSKITEKAFKFSKIRREWFNFSFLKGL